MGVSVLMQGGGNTKGYLLDLDNVIVSGLGVEGTIDESGATLTDNIITFWLPLGNLSDGSTWFTEDGVTHYFCDKLVVRSSSLRLYAAMIGSPVTVAEDTPYSIRSVSAGFLGYDLAWLAEADSARSGDDAFAYHTFDGAVPEKMYRFAFLRIQAAVGSGANNAGAYIGVLSGQCLLELQRSAEELGITTQHYHQTNS